MDYQYPRKFCHVTARARGLAGLLLVVAGCLPAVVRAAGCPDADPEALKWLDKMSRSSHHTTYQGVVTLQRGEEMQVIQVSHSIDGENSSEQLTRLTGQGAQVVRDAHPLNCVHTGHRLLQLGAELEAGECGVARYYRIEMQSGERIAGRQAVKIRVEPRDVYRYGYLMELDRETGLLLRSRTLGRRDLELERFQFANLSYGNAGASGASIDVVHKTEHPAQGMAGKSSDGEAPMTGATSSPGLVPWNIGWLPRGFAITEGSPGSDGRRTYTDGLAAFSVFLEPLARQIRPGEGVARQGSTTSYTRGLSLSGQAVLVTVIGEVPVNTARMVADSVHWTQ